MGRVVSSTLALTLVGTQAAALTPLPLCDVLTGYEAGYSGYSPAAYDGGVVAYELYTTAGLTYMMVEHCPSRTALAISYPAGMDSDPAQEVVWDMLDAPQGYTLQQIGQAAEDRGGFVQLGQIEYESCACRLSN